MEAFEKWWRKQEVSKYNPGAWGAYANSWRAALNYVRTQVCPEAWDVVDVEDFIEEELKEN